MTTALIAELELPDEEASLLLHAEATMHVNAVTAPSAARDLALASTPIFSPERSRPMLTQMQDCTYVRRSRFDTPVVAHSRVMINIMNILRMNVKGVSWPFPDRYVNRPAPRPGNQAAADEIVQW
ncbi:MAG: hypothetical protein ACRDOU_00995 [Streptosporangiaceae bacterium]